MNLAVRPLPLGIEQREVQETVSHSGAGNMGPEAENKADVMLMTSLEPEPVTPWEKQELLKVHLKCLRCQCDGCATSSLVPPH